MNATLPARPVLGATAKAELKEINRQARATYREIRAELLTGNPEPLVQALAEEVGQVLSGTSRFSAKGQAEVNAYNAQVRRYNAALRAQREAAARNAQIRKNASEVAKVRAAACPVCFASHPGEC